MKNFIILSLGLLGMIFQPAYSQQLGNTDEVPESAEDAEKIFKSIKSKTKKDEYLLNILKSIKNSTPAPEYVEEGLILKSVDTNAPGLKISFSYDAYGDVARHMEHEATKLNIPEVFPYKDTFGFGLLKVCDGDLFQWLAENGVSFRFVNRHADDQKIIDSIEISGKECEKFGTYERASKSK